MHHFSYVNSRLHAEGVPLDVIADQVGTPCYVYSTATLTRHYAAFAEAFADLGAMICFAMKANGNTAVLRLLSGLGAGMDVVSGGEMALALSAGVPAGRIVFSGVGKTEAELEAALQAGVHQINVESEPELDALDAVARRLGVRAPIAIRVNPDVDAATHAKITTGRAENKFGIEWTSARRVFRRAMTLEGIAVKGIAVHIGSQILDLSPFEAAFRKVRDLVALLRADGVTVERLDLGGGLGVPYHAGYDETPPPPAAYADVVRRTLGDLGCALTIEPGRAIAGNAGVLVSRVIYLKEGVTRAFAIVDAAMNDLVRPAMYDAWHDIRPVVEPGPGVDRRLLDVVGPVCESSDTFARERSLPPLAAGDLVAFMTAGAYGAVMANQYNGRPLVPEVLVHGDRFHVVRRRPSVSDLAALEDMPPWL